MTLKVNFRKTSKSRSGAAIAAVYKDSRLSPQAEALDSESGGLIRHVLKTQKAFTGKPGQVLSMTAPRNSSYGRLLLVGIDESGDLPALEVAGGKLAGALKGTGTDSATLFAPGPEAAAHIALGFMLRGYEFTKYKSAVAKDAEPPVKLERLDVVTPDSAKAARLFGPLEAAAQGVLFARDLVNEPPNELYPESFAARLKAELQPLGVEVEVIDERKMQKLGFGAHLAVGMGSARPPCVVVMRWRGRKAKKPVAFVGKGITFDTGGISIKPAASMDEMKMDMGGAAAVAGMMRSLAARKAKADVVGVVALAENMPSDRAYRPGDILKSLSGKTIEVLNTDAEGRLVLCDALTYIQNTYDPALVIDLATLTGAIMVALGHEYCGVFVNDDEVWTGMNKAGRETGEKLWRMPLDEAYRKEMESAVADLRNLGSLGRYGGACSAAGFLEHFIDKGRPWAHMDIAGTAWVNSDRALGPKHATGFGVRVLDRLVADLYEG